MLANVTGVSFASRAEVISPHRRVFCTRQPIAPIGWRYAYLLVMVAVCLFSTALYAAPNDADLYRRSFLEDEITLATTERNNFLSQVAPESSSIDVRVWSDTERRTALQTLSSLPEGASVWPLFLNGIVRHIENAPASGDYFSKALQAAAERSAETWLLFIEFERYDISSYADSALSRLDKSLCLQGATGSTLLSWHLFLSGKECVQKNQPKKALRFFTLAHRFNKRETFSIRERIGMSFPFNFSDLFAALNDYSSVQMSSWQAQLHLANQMYLFLSHLCIIFIVLITVTFCVKYFPQSLHFLVHLLPGTASLSVRLLLVTLIVCSTLLWGFIPFFWICAFLLWSYLNKKEKTVFSAAIVLILLSPLDTYLRANLAAPLVYESDLMKLTDALYENPPQTTDRRSDTYLSLLSDAVAALKQASPQTASRILDKLPSGYTNDPVLDNIRGITHFFMNNVDSATFYFKKVLTYDNKNYAALFNLSRCAMRRNDPSEALDFLKDAATSNPSHINSYIQTNDTFFADAWPPLRQIMFSDYSSAQFWQRLFTLFSINTTSYRLYWGLSFAGIPPLPSAVIFLALSCLLIATGIKTQSDRKLKRLFDCKCCGKVVCRRCAPGVLCPTCASKINSASENIPEDKIKAEVIARSRTITNIRFALFNLLLPGSGDILSGRRSFAGSVFAIIVSCFFYVVWISILAPNASITRNSAETIALVALVISFHLYAVLRYLPELVRQCKVLFHTTTLPGAP